MKKIIDRCNGLRIEHLWVLAVLIGIFVFINTHPIQQYDFWFHIATGRDIIRTGSVPQVDTFSFTAFGAPYPSNNIYWLMQIVLFSVYDAGGAAWTILFTSLTITTAYGILIWIGFQLTGNWRAAAAGGLFAAALSIDNWNVRPQIMAYLYASLCLLIILTFRQKSNRAWLVAYPFVMVCWVNSHGTFFLGLVLLAFWGLNEVWKVYWQWKITRLKNLRPLNDLFIVGAASGLACILNPLGIGIVHYITNVSTNRVIQDAIVEWQPPNFTVYSGILYLILLILTGLFLIMNWRQTDLFQVLCFSFFGMMGLRYVRAMIWFGIVLSPVVAYGTAYLIGRLKSARERLPVSRIARVLNTVMLGGMVSLAIFSLPWFKGYWPVIPEKRGLIAYNTPVEATQFLLDEKLPAQIFHDMGFGSYLTWAAVPQYRVFVDPRIELYPLEIWDDYLHIITAAQDWEDRLDRYGIQTLLLYRKDQSALIDAVLTSEDWEKQYQDEIAVIFTRR